ncbi:MAG: serine/threonine-protein kinase [Gemmatimonadales bacterium]
MTQHDPTYLFQETSRRLGERYQLERLVAASEIRILFVARDRLLNRRVGLRVHFESSAAYRAWFLREAEALAQLDHPAIRRVYDAGIVDEMAFRVGNWVEAEGLDEANARGPRPIPQVHVLARDLLRALEHAHSRGVTVRRVAPTSLLVNSTGRATISDLRFCSYVLPAVPSGLAPSDLAFMAPEIRDGDPGDPTSDVYTAGAVLYYAVTGTQVAVLPGEVIAPRQLRAACPRALERVIMRALRAAPNERYLTASEMLEDFASEAGDYTTLPTLDANWAPMEGVDGRAWEQRLRRALGDDYELIAEIGSGGFGRVYRVRDLGLERMVALKVLHPNMTEDPIGLERFRREAQLAARVNHPNIVDVYETSGRAGLVWYTMELVDGPNLAQLVDRSGPLPLDQVVRLLREALGAMAHAHVIGLVHRDIKPENLLIARGGSLRISDFGLAVALAGRFGGATSRSGTPQFASPEQLSGEKVDGRTDLYSLAAVAVFALTGTPPFTGATPEAILVRQTAEEIPNIRGLRPDIGPHLDRVLRQALRADPQGRFPTANEFLSALNRAFRRDQRRAARTSWLRRVADPLRGMFDRARS